MQNQKRIGTYYVYHNIISYRYVVCVTVHPSRDYFQPAKSQAPSCFHGSSTDSADVFLFILIMVFIFF